MCACRLECGGSTPTSPQGRPFDIDDYYSLADTMGDREGRESPGTPTEDDVYSQLAQKERDLHLAAELGKALLEKNAELERRNEQLIEEYSSNLEVICLKSILSRFQIYQRYVNYIYVYKCLWIFIICNVL